MIGAVVTAIAVCAVGVGWFATTRPSPAGDPVPLGTPATIDPAGATLTVKSVTIGDYEPGKAAITVDLLVDPGSEPVRIDAGTLTLHAVDTTGASITASPVDSRITPVDLVDGTPAAPVGGITFNPDEPGRFTARFNVGEAKSSPSLTVTVAGQTHQFTLSI